ncbi:MAG: aminotransferase class V-fold PLP-dependent enzyme [Proteobacteria bacterium]|nr:aminotransferase class V-fold PLP-dependent enzyme [Pseudomonadota bacterium]
MTDWAGYRRRFPALSGIAYLNVASNSPLSVGAAAAGKRYFDEILEGGTFHREGWLEQVEDARRAVARLLNAEPGEIAFVQSSSSGMNMIARMVAAPGDHILSNAGEFPSVTLPWLNQDIAISYLEPAADGMLDLSGAGALVRPNSKAFAASHIQYNSGFRYDLDALGEFCGNHGLALVIDATQSFGAHPIDVERSGVDALVFSGYKWATAGYGIAVLYLSERLLASSPLPVVGWRSARAPYDLVYDRLDITSEASAVEGGNPLFPGIITLGAALSLIEEIGVETIAARCAELTVYLRQRLDAAGYAIASPADPAHGSAITLVVMDDADGVAAGLAKRRVYTSARGGKLRLSLHYYNNEDDIDALITALGDIGMA